jgi:hypothetical protein
MAGRRMARVCPGRKVLDQRQREAGGLAGARLGGAEEVAACENDGDGLLLDGGRDGVSLVRDCADELGPEAK